MSMSYFLEHVNVTLHGEREFSGLIKLRTLRLGDYLQLFRGPTVMTRVLKNVIGRQKRRVRGRCDSKEWPKRGNVAGFEDRRRGSTNHKPRNEGGL